MCGVVKVSHLVSWSHWNTNRVKSIREMCRRVGGTILALNSLPPSVMRSHKTPAQPQSRQYKTEYPKDDLFLRLLQRPWDVLPRITQAMKSLVERSSCCTSVLSGPWGSVFLHPIHFAPHPSCSIDHTDEQS